MNKGWLVDLFFGFLLSFVLAFGLLLYTSCMHLAAFWMFFFVNIFTVHLPIKKCSLRLQLINFTLKITKNSNQVI